MPLIEKPIFSLIINKIVICQFQDHALEEVPNPNGSGFVYTGRVRQRLFLVLDCVTAQQFSEKGSELINLQQYVTKVKKVIEREALLIFYDIVRVVANLHKVGLDRLPISAFLSFLRRRHSNKTLVKSVPVTPFIGFW